MRAPGFRFSGLKMGFSAVKAAGTGLLFDLYLSVMERGLTRRFLCVVVACMGATMVLPAQSAQSPSRMKQFNITVNFENYTVKTQVLGQSKSLSADNERSYLWYSSQKIMETRGGYDGKLIHGIYRAFYLNDQLKERGRIRYGIRQGEWKYWYPDGKLKEVITWKKGVKQGPYALYNDYGQLMARGRFRKDKLHGMFRTYAPGGQLADKKKYRRGEEVTPKKTRSLKREKKPEPPKPAPEGSETNALPSEKKTVWRWFKPKQKENSERKNGTKQKSGEKQKPKEKEKPKSITT